MTLNLTLISQHGSWQCTDYQLSDGKPLPAGSYKHLGMKCRDGTALIAYAGVGSVGNVFVSDWMRMILRGTNRTVRESVAFLHERADADLGPACMTRGLHHMFSVAALIGGKPWTCQIRNFAATAVDKTGPVRSRFERVAGWVKREGFASAFPFTHIDSKDRAAIARSASRKPRSPDHYAAMLAAINRRVSKRTSTVSAACTVSHIQLDGTVRTRSFEGVGPAVELKHEPFLLYGIDMTESMHAIVGDLRHRVLGEPAPPARPDLSVTPMNPLSADPLPPAELRRVQ